MGKSATSVLTALCYAIIEDAPSEEQVHLYSIYTMLVEHGTKMIDRFNSLDLFFQQKPFGNLAKNSYATGSFAKGETRATLFSVLATVIKMFSDTGLANLTSRTDFELEDICVSWDNGRTLALIYGVDKFEVIDIKYNVIEEKISI